MSSPEPIFLSNDDVLAKLEPTFGHTFAEYDINHRLDNPENKGALGQIVEEGILGYCLNSSPEADIPNLGLEIKVTGLIQTNNGALRAKERLTIDALNYSDAAKHAFDESAMWAKADKMLLVFYRYLDGVPYGDMPIIKAVINEFDPVDVEIIRRDYEYIREMIASGRADDISEGDTMFLGACTSGTGTMVSQPYSSAKAKQRKFCLKQSYFSQLVRKYVTGEEFEHVLDLEDVKRATFEVAMKTSLQKFFGLSEKEIRERFSMTNMPMAKNRYERYIASMLEVSGNISETDEFQKAGIQIKTVRVQENGSIKESMSFPYFRYSDIYSQTWEESDLRNMFASTKYMFVIFKEKAGELYFEGIRFWHMKELDLDKYVRPVFEQMKNIIASGNIVSHITTNSSGKTIRHTNFPGMSDNPIVHVRPHARDANDTCDLPVPDRLTGVTKFTKHCFWLNSAYVASIITDN